MEGLVNLLDYPVYSTTFCVFPFCAIHYIVEVFFFGGGGNFL